MSTPFPRAALVGALLTAILATVAGAESAAAPKPPAGLAVRSETFGKLPDGREVRRYVLANANGLSVDVIDYGAVVTAVRVPDARGKVENVTLGFDSLEGWLKNGPYFGATCGRYANRIAGGKFTLDGKTYDVTANENGRNLLHGGAQGFDKRLWKSEPIELRRTKPTERSEAVGVALTYVSAAGEEGFPGRLTTTVRYLLNDADELHVEYEATTDAPTVVNLTNHCYWNLGGPGTGDVLDHRVALHANRYLPVDEHLIPTGDLAPVKGTPFDFTEPKPIGAAITALGAKRDEVGTGVDHCFVVDGKSGELRPVATVTDPDSGRVMTIHSTEPGVQFYTGNFLDGSAGSAGYGKHAGFCLECNHFPDSPNHPRFPSTVLRPGETYRQTTVHRFSAMQ